MKDTTKKKIQKYIKKVPKKKIVTKAASYGIQQVIGGPYLDLLGLLYKKTRKKAVSYVGSYAYESFFRSKFAREKINAIPMSVISLILRFIFNFLVFSHLQTGIEWLDFIISMIITILITLLSPIFYTSIQAHEENFMRYTNIFINNFLGPNGWEYVERVKKGLFLTIGIFLIILLQWIEVNSRYLQGLIVHMMITGFISDQIMQYIVKLSEIKIVHIGMEYIDAQAQYISPVILPYRKVKQCNTKNIIIISGMKPLQISKVKISKNEIY